MFHKLTTIIAIMIFMISGFASADLIGRNVRSPYYPIYEVDLDPDIPVGIHTLGKAFSSYRIHLTHDATLDGGVYGCDIANPTQAQITALVICDLLSGMSADVDTTGTTGRRYIVVQVTIAETGNSPLTIRGTYNTSSGGGGSAAVVAFTPDETSDDLGFQAALNTACTAGVPVVFDIPAGSWEADTRGMSAADLRAGVIQFPEKCNEVTFRGQGMNTTKLNFLYDLVDADNGADAYDFRGIVLRGNRWIKFENLQLAARNACQRDYTANFGTHAGNEDCNGDPRLFIDIDEATDLTPSRNVTFDEVHIHFPTIYYVGSGGGWEDFHSAFRVLSSEEVHLTNSVVHANGLPVQINRCESCTVNYNWFGSAFPLAEGPHGVWIEGNGVTHESAPVSADQSDADYSREAQSFVTFGIGEGKELIGNRFDHEQLPYSAMRGTRGVQGTNPTGWATNGKASMAFATLIPDGLAGEVPKHAIVTNNSSYNIMDRTIACLYFINYNGAVVQGNQCRCADPTGADCEGGSLVRMISQATNLPSEAFNRENIFIGNRGGPFPTDYGTTDGSHVQQNVSCITIYEPTSALQSSNNAMALLTNVDNTFIGNKCDSVGTKYFAELNESGTPEVTIPVARRQEWSRGNTDLSNDAEFFPGAPSLTVSTTAADPIPTSRVCGSFLNNLNAVGTTIIDLPYVSPSHGAMGCWFKATIVQGSILRLCASPGQYFEINNDPRNNSNTGTRCIEGNTFEESIEIEAIHAFSTNITSVSTGTSTVIGYTDTSGLSNGNNDQINVGDRIILSGMNGFDEAEGREFFVTAETGGSGIASSAPRTITLQAVNEVGNFDSTGMTAWTSGGTIQSWGWGDLFEVGTWNSVAR